MPQVRMPDGVLVNFPDEMPKEQIRSMIATKFPDAVPKAQEPMPSVGKTVFDQAMQGATFGFADEITDPIGSLIASAAMKLNKPTLSAGPALPLTEEVRRGLNPSVGDIYGNARETTIQELKAQQEQRPVLSTIANIGGGLATGLAASGTKAGTALASRMGTGLFPQARGLAGRAANLLSKSLIGSAAGASSGALYGLGSAEPGHRIEGLKQGAVIGGAIGAGVPLAGAAVSGITGIAKQTWKGLRARDAEMLDDAAMKIKDRATSAYSKMRDIGAQFKPEATNRIFSSIDDTLKLDGPLNKGLHGKTMSIVDDLKSASSTGDFDLEKLDQWRQLLGQVASNRTPDNLQDARKATIAIDALDNAVSALKSDDLISGSTDAIDALKFGRAEYARQAKFNTVADIVKKADGDANYMKRELKKLLDNPKKTRGFTKDEMALLKEASRLSTSEKIGKTLGRFGFDVGNSRIGTGVGGAVGGGVGYALGGPVAAAAVPIVGTAGRTVQKGVARAKAEDLLKLIESGAQVSTQDIMQLPPREGMKLLSFMKSRQMP